MHTEPGIAFPYVLLYVIKFLLIFHVTFPSLLLPDNPICQSYWRDQLLEVSTIDKPT